MSSYQFTWEHGRGGEDFVEEKLDRILTNREWQIQFAQAKGSVLQISSSDLLPVSLDLSYFIPRGQSVRFRFENN